MLNHKKIAIVGGGPGGLTLARLLQIVGANVHVYERDFGKDARVQGATLDLHEESGLEALRRAGLLDAFYTHYRPDAGRVRLLDKYARIHLDDHTSDRSLAEDRPEIDRAPLRKILLESLQEGTVVWDSQFVSMERKGEGWLMQFKNGSSAYADIVIAADGANSKIRPYVTAIKPVYSGVTIVEGNIYNAASNAPRLWELVKGGKIFAFGDEQSLILSAKGEGSLSFYTGCKVAEDWTETSGIDFNCKEEVAGWFMKTFGTWDNIWQELFAGEEMWFLPRPQYHFPLDQHWETLLNLTLIGDAAHRMPPYAGEGVNMAMQDAYELAECLTRDSLADIHTAIADYEARMLRRASEVTQLSLEMTEMLHSEDPIPQMVGVMNGE